SPTPGQTNTELEAIVDDKRRYGLRGLMDDFARLGRTEDVPALTAALLPLGDT
ncbi:MAG: hypothetical protein ACI84E_001319, partial [Planctomycetota bacterium]